MESYKIGLSGGYRKAEALIKQLNNRDFSVNHLIRRSFHVE